MTLQRTTGPSRAKRGSAGRKVAEMLGDVDYYFVSPDGPWSYKSLTVERYENTILVEDVDGVRCAYIEVSDLPNGDEANYALKRKLDRINEETLDAL